VQGVPDRAAAVFPWASGTTRFVSAVGETAVFLGDYDKALADFKTVLELSNNQALRHAVEQQLRKLGAQ
jgi:hypothetical protein